MESISELFARKSEKPKAEVKPTKKISQLEQIRALFERDNVEPITIMRRPIEPAVELPAEENSYKKALVGDNTPPKKETQLDTRDWNLISDDE